MTTQFQPAASRATVTHTAVTIMQLLQRRAAERDALWRDPMVPSENRQVVMSQFDAQTGEQVRPLLERAAQHIGQLRASNVKTRFTYLPDSMAGASLLATAVAAAPTWTDSVLMRRLDEARADGNLALVQELRDQTESRLARATGEAAVQLNHALYDANVALASTPEAQASAEWETWADNASFDLRFLAGLAASDDPAGRLQVYLDLNALPVLLPVSHDNGVTTIGATATV
jgi:hypothetical protein